jgi:cytochrome c oxidase assembly factor CtaG
VIALVSPIHEMGEALFSAHMAQHEILMAVAAPLLAVSRPGVRLLRGIPLPARKALVRWTRPQWIRKPWHAFSDPVSAWFLHAAALWGWHAPPLFQATLRSDWIHAAQHISFLGSALLFWSALFRGRAAIGAGIVYVFSTAVHSGILGALLTFAPKPWYPAYASTTAAWGLTPLEDQQLGGLIMWVPAGVLYTVAGLWMLAEWIKSSEYRYAA